MKTNSKEPDADVRAATAAEIARQMAVLNDRRNVITAELQQIYSESLRNGGAASAILADDDERAAREIAKRLLGGQAPASLALPPQIARERELFRERRGIDLALQVLGSKELENRAAATLQWAEDHGQEWIALCRETVLNAVRGDALRRRADEMLTDAGGIYAPRLPMTSVVGRGVSTNDLAAAAIAEGILTRAEIRKAEHVE